MLLSTRGNRVRGATAVVAVRSIVVVWMLATAACQAPDPRQLPRPGPVPAGPPPTLEQQIAELSAASAPGPMHKRLDVLAGDWTVRLCEVAVDQSERDLAHGEAHIAWVHDGRFLQWEAKLDLAGSTSGFLGFDRRQEQYQLLMISSLSSGMGVASGFGDLDGSGIRFSQEMVDPRTGSHLRMSSALRSISPDHFVLDAMGVDEHGVERVVRRTHYQRVKR